MNNNDRIKSILVPLSQKAKEAAVQELYTSTDLATKKRVWCLYRVSTAGQVDHDDIPLQRIECRAFAEQKGWHITNELQEKGVSGYKVSSNDRDAIIEAKRAALAGEFDILLVFMFDRIGRREDETPFVVQWFVENGIEVWSTREGQQRFDTHVDKLLNYIRYWQASGESEKTSMRIAARHEQLIEEGHYCGGLVPYGYRLENLGRENKKKQPVKDLVVDEVESQVVCEIFTKATDEGWGNYRIANWLNERGIPTKRGKTMWRDTSVRALLRNPVYTGRLKMRRGYTVPFDHLRIIADATFIRAIELMQSRSTHDPETASIGPQRTDSGGLLTGLIYCADCESRLSINHCKKVKNTSTGRHEYRWNVYRCFRKHNSKHTCHGQSTYRAETVEAYVEDVVRDFFSRIRQTPNDAMLEAALKREVTMQRKSLQEAQDKLEKARRELAVLEEETVKALTGENTFPTDFITNMIPKRQAALEHAQQDYDQVLLEKQIEDEALESTKIAVGQAKEWAAKYDAASLETKRMILTNIINRVLVGRDYQIHIEFKLSVAQFLGETA